jgi:hypothetical protein
MTTRPARRRSRVQVPTSAFQWPAPPPVLSTWPEAERRAVLARWDAERDRVAAEGHDAEPDSVRRQDAEGLLQHIDAIRADLTSGPVLTVRLSTLERRLAEFRQGPLRERAHRVAEQLSRHRLGYRATPPAWQAVVRSLLRQHPLWSFDAVWDHLVQLTQEKDHPILHEAIRADDPRRACETVGTRPCPSGAHLHYWGTRKRLRALAFGTVRNFVSAHRPR